MLHPRCAGSLTGIHSNASVCSTGRCRRYSTSRLLGSGSRVCPSSILTSSAGHNKYAQHRRTTQSASPLRLLLSTRTPSCTTQPEGYAEARWWLMTSAGGRLVPGYQLVVIDFACRPRRRTRPQPRAVNWSQSFPADSSCLHSTQSTRSHLRAFMRDAPPTQQPVPGACCCLAGAADRIVGADHLTEVSYCTLSRMAATNLTTPTSFLSHSTLRGAS